VCGVLEPPAQAQNLQMTWVDRSGNALGIVGPSGPYRGPDLAPDGKRFVVHRHDDMDASRNGGGDVWLFESGTGPGTRLAGDGSGKIENVMPIWSPDGSRIAFGSLRNGKGGLYVKRADGTGAEKLLIESETTKIPMSWSPDGRYIVYWEPTNTEWMLPLTGNPKPFQLSNAATSHAQISPDGRWIAYTNEAARAEIYIKPFPIGSGEVRVSKDGGAFPRWRADGKELYFLSAVFNGQMMAADITVNGSAIQAGTPHALFDPNYADSNHPSDYHRYAVSRDGQRFLIPRRSSTIAPDDPAARTLTIFDRQGQHMRSVGERGYFNQIFWSPDQTHVSMTRTDPITGLTDLWIVDVASGQGVRITSVKRDEAVRTPVWSPDGKQIAYVFARNGNEAIYRKASTGGGAEELVYKLNGAGIVLQEWTPRYLIFVSQQLGGNIVFALPTADEASPVEIVRSPYVIGSTQVSLDHRFVAFHSLETGNSQVWVQRFDPSRANGEKWQISTDGGTGPVFWRSDGKELYYLTLDRGLMAVSVRTDSGVEFSAPRLLFKIPEAFPAGRTVASRSSMSPDGERFMFAVPPPPPPSAPLSQIRVLDRHGKALQTVGSPDRYSDPVFSPDGSRVLVRKSPETAGNTEFWIFDLASGKGTLLASSNQFAFPSPLWSSDGKQVYYVVDRAGGLNAIVRKAADGTGREEDVFRYTPGAPVNLDDITPDGKYLTFASGGVILTVPLTDGDVGSRHATEILRDEYFAYGARFSPDGRWIAYISTETDRPEVYVRAFDPTTGHLGASKLQLTKDGVSSIVSWRADGRELYYRKGDMKDALTMRVEVSTGAGLQRGTPRFVFRGPSIGGAKNIRHDGERLVVVTP